jgi:hypothetical protein
MSRTVRILGVFVLTLACGTASALAGTVRVLDNSTPVRVRPNADSDIVSKLASGTLLEANGREGDWLRVTISPELNGVRTGYVLARLVEPVVERDTAVQSADSASAHAHLSRSRLNDAASQTDKIPARVPINRTTPVRSSLFANDKVWVDVNLGAAQSAIGKESYGFGLIRYSEPAAMASAYDKPTAGAEFDFGAGYMFTPLVGVGVSFTGDAYKGKAGLAATIPHPYYFNASATDATVTKDELTRTEGGVNIQIAVAPVRTERATVRLFGGPTYFRLKRQMVDTIYYEQQYGMFTRFNTISIDGWDGQEVEGNGWGFHGGADLGFFFSNHVGVGTTVRISHGSVSVAEPLSGDQVSMTTGGVHFGGGLRLRF